MVSNAIQFIYNNRIYTAKDFDPNKTILEYIRQDLKTIGTKEGCAEGGCGACTVVIGELKNNKVIYKSINSCISFLPSIHGKHLILVENLKSDNGRLHPVQDAMVKFHGSQCGFCTPGFIMSLFAMYKNHSSFDKETIEETLSGNLCRCTGYRPIIDAAKSLNKKKDNDQFKKNQKKIINLLKKINNKNFEISYRNKKFYAPKSLSNLKKILMTKSNTNFLSGGTDLSLEVTKSRGEIQNIISLNSIQELKFVKREKNFLEIGAGVSLYDFQNIIKFYYLDFYNVLKRYGSIQIRNVGTIAGNIATASPIGDTLPLLLSLDAIVKIQNKHSIKSMPLNRFFISYRKTRLKKNEIIYSVKIPISSQHHFKAYKISKRFDDDISTVCASFNFLIKKNKIVEAKIAYGGMSEIPKRATLIEKKLINSKFSEKVFLDAKVLIENEFTPIDDMRASKEYRIDIAKNLLMKFFYEVNSKKNIRVN
jgi:xanthine dehydrogenase small subunit|tara:strand:- start:196 stop:1632 length:1437 start_codon:yes stop_codon:yes gene_type:complete